MPVHSQTQAAVAVITIDQPPVNGLGLALRRDLMQALQRAQADDAVRAVVVTGAGRMFSGGADIREFNAPEASQAPSLHDLIDAFEASSKPIVMALNGTTLGGGLELALAADARVAASAAPIGLPEVALGLLPGAGGTQRLPRAVGVARALDMIVSGKAVPAADLADTRLFDRVVDADVVTAAVQLAGSGLPRTRVRDWPVPDDGIDAALAKARAGIAATGGAGRAAARCVDAVEAAARLPFKDGMAAEHGYFAELLDSPESKALRHVFFAERTAGHGGAAVAGASARPVQAVAVIGAGTMGGGIAVCFLDAGLPVTLVERDQATLDRGVGRIRDLYASAVGKGRLDAGTAAARLDRLQPTVDLERVVAADLVVEAVYESWEVKEALFRRLDALARPGAVLASNTSTLDLDRLAAVTSRPQDVVGMHFFSPAQVMRLLEVVRCASTAPDVLATALAVGRRIGKTAVVAGVCDGFIGNRMLEQYLRQACFLLDEGVLPQRVDRAMEGFGFAMGPFRMSDLAGNDIGQAIRQRRQREMPALVYSPAADLVCAAGRFGQKVGKGWYDYRDGDRRAHASAEVEALLAQHVRALDLPTRVVDNGEIVERLLFALVNEGADVLADGIAARASDIDVVYVAGYGFPRWRGGPMYHADRIGLARVLTTIERFAQGYRGEDWTPSPLLVRLAGEGAGFADAGALAGDPRR